MKIFVARLSYKTTTEDLRALYEQFGTVSLCRVIMDHDTYLPIGENYKETFNSYLDSKFRGKK